ncbi:methyltransferase domain-containing protein [Algoriphagus sp. A40]|uniref:methyltransferase domain-containing protein n=1 Tax=Algoriphagus sp. A40 TaxID=1945863 RepID=UPI0009854337|nr:methyltransferase domain-containing protein [Algoriphagus sp. A40]OOG67955.1 hypothetical protein B0E43_22745 [Algoriphagus sp. A40]
MIRYFVQLNRNASNSIIKYLDSILGSISDSEKYFYSQFQKSYINSTVLEIGGTGRPIFRKDDIGDYIGLDIDTSFDFKEKYHKYFAQSCEEENENLKADMIFSKYLLEHVPNNSKTFKNIEDWLIPGGKSVHIFPLGFHPFSLANKLAGNKFAKKLIPILRPGTEAITGYPAFYNLCNSWDLHKVASNSKLKYKVKYFFGAEDYFAFFLPLSISVYFFNRFCHLFRLNIFASNAVLIINK